MSWLAKNYEKAALGGAILCAVGLAFAGWRSLSKVENDFVNSTRGSGGTDTSVASADKVAGALASLRLERKWTLKEDDGRPVNLFTSVPLFVTSSAPDRPVDLLKDDPVHPPIPNIWWLENRIDPGYEDSPDRDPDGDGFSNLEEFLAGTNPNDPESFPPLIAKLKYLGDETLTWAIRPSFPDGENNSFRYLDSQGRTNNSGAGTPIAPGGEFYVDEPAQNRFRFVGHIVREVFNERLNVSTDETFAQIEDLKPNKAGTIYELPAPLSDVRLREFPEFQQYDRTAILSLEAIGLGGQEFKVEEYTAFALPPDAAEKNHFLKSVTPEEIVVEYTDADGNKQSVTIQKGSLPQM